VQAGRKANDHPPATRCPSAGAEAARQAWRARAAPNSGSSMGVCTDPSSPNVFRADGVTFCCRLYFDMRDTIVGPVTKHEPPLLARGGC
jgi:hypothetical protein